MLLSQNIWLKLRPHTFHCKVEMFTLGLYNFGMHQSDAVNLQKENTFCPRISDVTFVQKTKFSETQASLEKQILMITEGNTQFIAGRLGNKLKDKKVSLVLAGSFLVHPHTFQQQIIKFQCFVHL